MNPHLQITFVQANSPYMALIRALWRQSADTLGFFPEGAFDEHASKKQILIATDNNSKLAGYLLFRVTSSRNDASIVHLCVDANFRNQGVAKSLVDELRIITCNLRGIGLWCRRDFEVSKLWPKLGFHARNEKDGRSINGSTLTYWWLDNKLPDLFSESKYDEITKLNVVIDANIFYDLQNRSNEESLGLYVDWLQESLELFITDELFNEIDRSDDKAKRELSRQYTSRFQILNSPTDRCNETHSNLKKYKARDKEQDRSDFKQIANAIAGDAEFFITRDDYLLNLNDEIYAEFGVLILRPSDLITRIDSLYRENLYKPSRLAGTLFGVKRVQGNQESSLSTKFQNQHDGEKLSQIRDKLRTLISTPLSTECFIANDTDGNPLGLIAYDLSNPTVLKIPLLRVASRESLASTICRYLVGQILRRAISGKYNIIEINDGYAGSITQSALSETGFHSVKNSWVKFSLPVQTNLHQIPSLVSEVAKNHQNLGDYPDYISALYSDPIRKDELQKVWEIEDKLWPLQISDSEIPCFIVPVKAQWAQQLFEENFANNDLFGAKLELALSNELIFYRSYRNSGGLSAPARILWYVSTDPKFPGSGSIRAHSRLEEVIVDKPKPLYKKFRRLGIYEWKDVLKTAGDNIDGNLMALRFQRTILLDKPCGFHQLKDMLSQVDIRTTLQSPYRIPSQLFFSIISLI